MNLFVRIEDVQGRSCDVIVKSPAGFPLPSVGEQVEYEGSQMGIVTRRTFRYEAESIMVKLYVEQDH
jgi:hypothetical protein